MKLPKMFVTGLLALSIASGTISAYAADLVYKSGPVEKPVTYEDDSKEEQYLSLNDELIDIAALESGDEVLKTFTLTNDSENTVLVGLRFAISDVLSEILEVEEIADEEVWKKLKENVTVKIYGEGEDEVEASASPEATEAPIALEDIDLSGAVITSAIDADIVIDEENLTAVAAAYATEDDLAAEEADSESTVEWEAEPTEEESNEANTVEWETEPTDAPEATVVPEETAAPEAAAEPTVTPEDLTVIYDSELDETAVTGDTKDIALAYLEPDEEQTFIISVQLKESSDINISLIDAMDVGLTVITPDEDEIGTIENGVVVPKSDATEEPTAVPSKSAKASTASKTNPKTGDRSSIGLAAVMCLGALAGIVLIYKKGKEEV